jgi:hypothetical protein
MATHPVTTAVSGGIGLGSGLNGAPGIALTSMGRMADSGAPLFNQTDISGALARVHPLSSSASVGATSLTLAVPFSVVGSDIDPGDRVLIVQDSDGLILAPDSALYGDGSASTSGRGANRMGQAGRFEYVTARSSVNATGGVLQIAGSGPNGGLVHSYLTGGVSSVYVMRVPVYADARLTGTVRSDRGYTAFDVLGQVDFQTFSVNENGNGFNGGGSPINATASATTNFVLASGETGSKGWGPHGKPRYVSRGAGTVDDGPSTYPGGDGGRGAPGPAGGGGNRIASGGGGGGNALSATWGGTGGGSSGGIGGVGITLPGQVRLVRGAGGGGGHRSVNLGAGLDAGGGDGGGAVIVRAGNITGAPGSSISVNGNSRVGNSDALGRSGAGGGGGGGTIVLSFDLWNPMVSLSAQGGAGGSVTAAAAGAGGGGAGGQVYSGAVSTRTGGAAGTGGGIGAQPGLLGSTSLIPASGLPGVALDGTLVVPTWMAAADSSQLIADAPINFTAGRYVDFDMVNPLYSMPAGIRGQSNGRLELTLAASEVNADACWYVELLTRSSGTTHTAGAPLPTAVAPACTAFTAPTIVTYSGASLPTGQWRLSDLRVRLWARSSSNSGTEASGIAIDRVRYLFDWQGITWEMLPGRITSTLDGTTRSWQELHGNTGGIGFPLGSGQGYRIAGALRSTTDADRWVDIESSGSLPSDGTARPSFSAQVNLFENDNSTQAGFWTSVRRSGADVARGGRWDANLVTALVGPSGGYIQPTFAPAYDAAPVVVRVRPRTPTVSLPVFIDSAGLYLNWTRP